MSGVLMTARAYGRRVGLRVPAGDVDDIRPWLPHWWADDDVEPEREWSLTSAAGAEYVLRELELWVAEHAVDLIFVHAGVVAVDGRALLLPGRSFSGKTALTAALLRAGAAYGSDEYAVLDHQGQVHPYSRPLSVRGTADRTRMPAAAFGATTFHDPLPIGLVADLRHVPGSPFDVHRISSGTAVLRLFDNTVCAQSRAETAMDVLIATTTNSLAVSGTRGDADEAVGPLLDLLSRSRSNPGRT